MEIEMNGMFSNALFFGMGTGLVVSIAWLLLCKKLAKRSELQHKSLLELPSHYEQSTIDQRLALLSVQRFAAGQGSPVDRLFVAGLMGVCVLGMAYILAWSTGIAPAGTGEREVIALIRETEFANRPALSSVLRVVDESIYTSRADYLMLTDVFHRVASEPQDLVNNGQ